MERQLKQLPEGFAVYEDGFQITYPNGGRVTLIPNSRYNPKDRGWVVINEAPNGAKWPNMYPSFKQLANALKEVTAE